ncbi:Ribokinase [Penicillium paradoxum]|uniref:Ribokinase n=1 Tax=Penicillium paradoxum TaxID=176176 RepID=UPI0025494CF5|nr:Ribokinase [Penicillium paradoxum]KAJ5781101.1 Ribokinase [Penicillium paradoxum]
MTTTQSTGKPQISIIGSLNIDFVTATPPLSRRRRNSHCNFPHCLRWRKRRMIGAVGAEDPYYGSLLKPALETSGVNTASIEQSTVAQTGSATIIVEEAIGGENRILVVPGANHAGLLSDAESIIATLKAQSSFPDIIVLQGEIPRSTTLALLEYFNRSTESTKVVFNPAPVFPEGIPLPALNGTSVLIMNETEVVQMARSIDGLPVGDAVEQDDLRPEELAPRFHERAGVEIVLITLGAKGVYFSTKTGRTGTVAGVKVAKVLDTTAAGDTFVGYFATAVARFFATGKTLEAFDEEIEGAVSKANSAAAMCVQRRGAMQSIPFAYDL